MNHSKVSIRGSGHKVPLVGMLGEGFLVYEATEGTLPKHASTRTPHSITAPAPNILLHEVLVLYIIVPSIFLLSYLHQLFVY